MVKKPKRSRKGGKRGEAFFSDSDDYMKAKDKAIKKAMNKKDESVFVAYKETLASQLSKKLGE